MDSFNFEQLRKDFRNYQLMSQVEAPHISIPSNYNYSWMQPKFTALAASIAFVFLTCCQG